MRAVSNLGAISRLAVILFEMRIESPWLQKPARFATLLETHPVITIESSYL